MIPFYKMQQDAELEHVRYTRELNAWNGGNVEESELMSQDV